MTDNSFMLMLIKMCEWFAYASVVCLIIMYIFENHNGD